MPVLWVDAGGSDAANARGASCARAETWLVRSLPVASALGAIHFSIVWPHCQQRGQVRTTRMRRKQGISGSKATAAILTGGLTLLATGLSRKEWRTQARCDACRSQWDF